MDFSIEIKDHNNYKVICITGDLNMFNAQIFKTHGEILLSENQYMAVDLTDTNYVDSSGMGAMLNLLKALKAKNRDLPLINANERVIEIFKLVKIDKVFTIIDNYLSLADVSMPDDEDDLEMEHETRVE